MKFEPMTPEEAEAVERLRVAFNGIPTGFRISRDEDWSNGSCVTRLQVSKPVRPHLWRLVAIIDAPTIA